VGRFPFGAPVLPCGTQLPDRPYPVLVLGAYPSALHVRWTPPEGYGPAVAALPVDNEPTPFWDGDPPEAQHLFETWRKQWFDPAWGTVTPAALNGPSGRDLAARWLKPLGYTREQAFIADCLPTARASVGVATRLADRYAPVVTALGAPPAALGPHPSENHIVTEAAAEQVDRLTAQLIAADPKLVVTPRQRRRPGARRNRRAVGPGRGAGLGDVRAGAAGGHRRQDRPLAGTGPPGHPRATV
jgi:hypothetical protein